MARIVPEEEYFAFIRESGAVEDLAARKPRGLGEIERWLTVDGKVCAWIVVRYFRGENELDFYLAD